MYSTFNEGKSVVAPRFIRTLKNKLYKHMTATVKNVYYDVLDDVVNEYNNTKHNTIKMKLKDNSNRLDNYKDPVAFLNSKKQEFNRYIPHKERTFYKFCNDSQVSISFYIRLKTI